LISTRKREPGAKPLALAKASLTTASPPPSSGIRPLRQVEPVERRLADVGQRHQLHRSRHIQPFDIGHGEPVDARFGDAHAVDLEQSPRAVSAAHG
jgi:hypothetical protein